MSLSFTLTLIEAQDLAVADSFSRSSDPYCIVALAQRDASGALGSAQRVHKTKTVKKTLSPVWNETVRVQAVRPDTTVCIEVWDWDRFKRDDFLGSTSLALQGYVAKGMVDEWLLLFDKQMRPASGRLHVQIECTPYTPGGAAAAIAAASPWADAPRAVVLKRRVFAKWVERTLRHPLLSSSSSSSSAACSDVIDSWSPAWFFELLSALVPLPLRSADATAAASVAGTPTNDSAMRLFRALCGIPAQFVLDPANLGSAQDHGSFTLRVLWECFNRLAKPERTCPDSTEEQVLRWFRDAAQLSKVAVFPKCLADGSVLTAALRSVGKLPSPAPVGLPAVLASLGPAIGLEHYLTAEELLDLDSQGAVVWLHHVFALCKPPPPPLPPLSPREPAPPVAATTVEQQQAPQVAPAPPAAVEATPTAAVQPTDPAEQFVCAARDGQTHIVRKLLPNADVNWVFDSKTALHHAAWNGNSSMVELLVRAGADTEIPNRFGSTAILLAAANGHLGVVQFLAENGAKVDRPGQNGWTAEIAARNQGHPEVAEFLSGLRSATRPIGASSSSISPSPQPALAPPTPPPPAAAAPATAPAQSSAPEGSEPHIDAFVDASEIQPPPAPTTMPSGAPVENPETCAQQ